VNAAGFLAMAIALPSCPTPLAYKLRLLFVLCPSKKITARFLYTETDRWCWRTDAPERENVSENEQLGDEGAASGIY
jgi:hypothetical protein